MGNPALRTEAVWKVFHQEAEEVRAVRGVTLTIQPGEFVVLAGPSGSGKTTLLNLIGGLTRPTGGKVWVDGMELTRMSSRELARLRLEKLGFIFQSYNLLPVLSALENAEFPLLLRGLERSQRERRVRELFQRTGLAGLEHAVQASCRGASSSGSPSSGRWWGNPPWSWRTSPPPTSTRLPATSC